MDTSMSDAARTYLDEAREMLETLEASLINLEEQPDDAAAVDTVFRTLHTIKGSGSMFGFTAVSDFTHQVEDLYSRVRDGEMPITAEIVTIGLEARDVIERLLNGEKADSGREVLQRIGKLLGEEAAEQEKPDAASAPEKTRPDGTAGGTERIWFIRFVPPKDLLKSGVNIVNIFRELNELGQMRTMADNGSLPDFAAFDPVQCYLSWEVFLFTAAEEQTIHDVFMFVEDRCELDIQLVETLSPADSEGHRKKIGEILVERGELTPQQIDEVLNSHQRLGELLVEKGLVSPRTVESALTEQNFRGEVQAKKMVERETQSIRVDSGKLDNLVDIVGELVTIQARLGQYTDDRGETELTSINEQMEYLINELRDRTMNIRMVPLNGLFTTFRRVVRDLSQELGKDVSLEIEGGDTELDKTIIDKLKDPLVHIVRNALDHGIESPEKRRQAGKTEAGTLYLQAYHAGAYVHIRVSDDGAGLDRDRILKKAVSKGLLAEGTKIPDREVYSLIFNPGFSTSEEATSVSGRGVGMDVVKKNIESIRGTVDVSSTVGEGSVFLLKIPLTLAIIDGLLVSVGENRYVVNLSSIEECVEMTAEDREQYRGRQVMRVRETLLPYIDLRRYFEIAGERPAIEQVVIVKVEDQQVGFLVDQIIGEHQTVIKPLGKVFADLEGVSGATILGDGTVALVLDLLKLVQSVETQQHDRMKRHQQHAENDIRETSDKE